MKTFDVNEWCYIQETQMRPREGRHLLAILNVETLTSANIKIQTH